MPTEYRLISPDGGAIGHADSIDGIVEIAKKVTPGRYRIEHVNADSEPAGEMSRVWGAHQDPQRPREAGCSPLGRLIDLMDSVASRKGAGASCEFRFLIGRRRPC